MKTTLLTVMAVLLVLAGASCSQNPVGQPGPIANAVDAGAGQPGGNNAAVMWTKIYADEDWYRANLTPERIFAGTLERVAEPVAATQAWAHRYKLDERFLYPGEQNATLDRLVGRYVEIRGKMSDVEFGEQRPNEIWPGAIRVVAAPVTQAAAFDIHFDQKDGAITVASDGTRTVFNVNCVGGIGDATITRNDVAWPKQVVLRLYLRGLEQLTVSCGDVTLTGSVLSHSGNARMVSVVRKPGNQTLLFSKDSPYWTEILVMDAKGKPVAGLPGDGGYFEIALPQALLAENAKMTIGWIDFYRE